jgi:hypothetical protein
MIVHTLDIILKRIFFQKYVLSRMRTFGSWFLGFFLNNLAWLFIKKIWKDLIKIINLPLLLGHLIILNLLMWLLVLRNKCGRILCNALFERSCRYLCSFSTLKYLLVFHVTCFQLAWSWITFSVRESLVYDFNIFIGKCILVLITPHFHLCFSLLLWFRISINSLIHMHRLYFLTALKFIPCTVSVMWYSLSRLIMHGLMMLWWSLIVIIIYSGLTTIWINLVAWVRTKCFHFLHRISSA